MFLLLYMLILKSVLKPISICRKPHRKISSLEHLPSGFGFHLVSPYAEFDPVLKKAMNEMEPKIFPVSL